MATLKSPFEMFQAMKRNMVEKTGKSFDDWLGIARKAGIDKFKPLLDHMKREHGVSHGYAQMIAWGVLDPARLDAGHDDESMVDDLYVGKKSALRPIYEKLISSAKSLGGDVEFVICKTYTSIRAKSQFAIFAPRTNGAVDVELAMPDGTPAGGRFETVKSSTPKIGHRIRIRDLDEVDDEVMSALVAAKNHNLSG